MLRQFSINPAIQQGMSPLEKEADTQFQIAQQCEGDFKNISQNLFPTLIMIGNQNPSLITRHVELLSSERFLGGSNHLVINAVLRGFKSMIPINPSFQSLIQQNSRKEIERLIAKVTGITDKNWMEVLQLAESVLAELDRRPIRMPKQVHISPNKPFDHFEAFATLISTAHNEVYYIDPYLGDDMSSFLAFLRKSDGSNKKLRLLTREDTSTKNTLESALNAFAQQGNHVELHYDNNSKKLFHDRWIVIDGSTVFKIGASLNGVAKAKSNKSFGIEKLEEPALSQAIKDVEGWWGTDSLKII